MSAELYLGTRLDGDDLYLDVDDLNYHAQIIGPTGYGKTRLLIQLFQELAEKTHSAQVLIDPTGGAYDFIKRWCYQKGFHDRVVLIDPGETRLVCGFNPLRPWPENRELQAMIELDIMRRAMGTEAFVAAPLMARWLFNMIHGLIQTDMTMHEADAFLDYNDGTMREAITRRLPPSPTRSDWEWLNGLMAQSSQSQMMRLVNEQLGSSVNRVRFYIQNPHLRLMLATERAIDWKEVIDQRKLVLVNLQQRRVLNPEHQRLLGMQIVNEIISEAFRREAGEEERVPCYLIMDEFQEFAAPGLASILTTGRQFLLRLILAHHSMSQLVDVKTQDPALYNAVIGSARTKIVFGGLPPEDAETMGRTLYGHHLDPDRVKREIWSWSQLSHVEWAESKNWAESSGRSLSANRTTSRAKARTTGTVRTSGSTRSTSSGFGSGASFGSGNTFGGSTLYGPDGGLIGAGDNYAFTSARQSMDSYLSSDSYSDAESFSDVDAETEMEGEATGIGASASSGRSEGGAGSFMVMPDEPFEQLSSVQDEGLEEQLYRHISEMIGRPQREAIIAISKDFPIPFRVASVPEPKIDHTQAREIDMEVMEGLHHYSEPQLIKQEIADRRGALLSLPPPVDDEFTPDTAEMTPAVPARKKPRKKGPTPRRP